MLRLAQFSGGADSLAAIIIMLRMCSGDNIQGLFFDYGQPYVEAEKIAVETLNELLKQKFSNWRGYISHDIGKLQAPEVNEFGGKPIEAYFPIRNFVLATISANFAISLGVQDIITGSKRPMLDLDDPWCFRDTGIEFYNSIQKTLSLATQFDAIPPRFIHPLHLFVTEPKTEALKIIKSAELPLDLIWSCFSAKKTPCGTCHACILLKEAKEKL